MAMIAAEQIVTKDGRTVTLRGPEPRDARALVAYMRQALATGTYLNRLPEEFSRTSWAQRRIIARALAAERELMILAEAEGGIVGFIEAGTDPRRRVRHVARFGVTVAEDWRGIGVGRALIGALIGWAEANPALERLELHVHSENEPAMALYKSLGFAEEGRRRRAIKYADGRYMDDIIMARFV
ncbi:MAG: GNAT family N-acetyltransferase [Sphingomonadales bacterium]|nr:GNAT family N-acetyltransferase [Sphingomonadales bacterium]